MKLKIKPKSCSAEIIAKHLTNPEQISEQCNEFFVNFFNQTLLDSTGMSKRSGTKAEDIIKDVVMLRLNNISIGSNEISLKVNTVSNSDTIYNYQKRSQNDVLELRTKLSKSLFKSIEPDHSSLEGGVLIVDDTIYERLYSQKTELASPQFDHTTGKYYMGYRNNQLSYYNRGIFAPVNAVPVSTSNPEKLVCQAKQTNSQTGQLKREMTQTKMTEVTLFQIDLALKNGFDPDYCVFDTWYTSPRMFLNLLDRNLYGIGMVKNSPKVKFKVGGESFTIREIFNRNSMNPQQLLKDDFYFSTIVEVECEGKCFPLKLCFYEADQEDRDFVCLATTDTCLSSIAVKKLYGIRWSTENYFADTKDAKSINSTKQSQCQSLDSIYFDIAMTEILYLFLVFILHSNHKNGSLRTMFHVVSSGLQSVGVYQAIIKTFGFYLEELSQNYGINKNELISFTSQSLGQCPDFIHMFLKATPFLNLG